MDVVSLLLFRMNDLLGTDDDRERYEHERDKDTGADPEHDDRVATAGR